MSDELAHFANSELLDDAVVFHVLASHLRDTETSYALRDEMISQLVKTPTQKVIIDLENVEFIGSIGFLAFLNTRRQFAEARIVLCNVSPNILKAFHVCNLVSDTDTRPGPFEVQSTQAAALASLRS